MHILLMICMYNCIYILIYMQPVQQRYRELQARTGPSVTVELETDDISINIPIPDGIEKDSWIVRPLTTKVAIIILK